MIQSLRQERKLKKNNEATGQSQLQAEWRLTTILLIKKRAPATLAKKHPIPFFFFVILSFLF